MAFRLDQSLSYHNLFEWYLYEFGVLEECIDCVNFENCEDIQHGAIGLTDFYCANNPAMERRDKSYADYALGMHGKYTDK